MKNRYFLILLFIGSLCSGANANDPTGWKEITWGSQPNAFQSVPGIVPLKEPSTEVFRGETLTAEFGIEEYRVAGIPFTVKFFFDHFGVFSAYTLTYSGEAEPTATAFLEITRLLRLKYKTANPNRNGPWTFGTTQLVTAELFKTEDGPSEIKISYMDTNVEELDKL